MSKSTLIECNLPFSESLLWRLQHNSYEKSGPRAWKISNNPFLARAYAHQTIAILRDWQNILNPNEPLYLLEIGAGSGKFSFLYLQELLKQLPFQQKLCLVISDNVETYLPFWTNHPKLKNFIEAGQIDFANYDPTTQHPCTLLNQNVDLSSSENPIIAIMNYFFAALPNDLYRYSNGTLEEGMPILSSDGITAKALREQPGLMQEVAVKFDYCLHDDSVLYPENPEFDSIIKSYQNELPDQIPFLLPTKALQTIQNLKTLSKHGLAIIGGDKSLHSIDELCKNCDHRPIVTDHGDINIDVNGDAIEKYVTMTGGEMLSYPAPAWHDYKDDLFSNWVIRFGPSGTHTPDAFNTLFVNGYSPLDCHKFIDKVLSGEDTFTVDQILSLLRLSHYDPELLYFYKEMNLKELFSSLKEDVYHVQSNVMHQIWEHYFWIGQADNHFGYLIAQAFYYLRDFDSAKTVVSQLIDLSGASDQLLYLLGLCYLEVKNSTKAQETFTKILELNPNHSLAKKHLT